MDALPRAPGLGRPDPLDRARGLPPSRLQRPGPLRDPRSTSSAAPRPAAPCASPTPRSRTACRYPIPAKPRIEGGSDRHLLLVDRDACRLYELFGARRGAGGRWTAGSGAVFDLASNRLRPAGWTSADAAGLPILPGLARWDEVGRRRHRPRPALHRAAHPAGLRVPGPPRRVRLVRPGAAADGPARAPEGVGVRSPGSGRRRGRWSPP